MDKESLIAHDSPAISKVNNRQRVLNFTSGLIAVISIIISLSLAFYTVPRIDHIRTLILENEVAITKLESSLGVNQFNSFEKRDVASSILSYVSLNNQQYRAYTVPQVTIGNDTYDSYGYIVLSDEERYDQKYINQFVKWHQVGEKHGRRLANMLSISNFMTKSEVNSTIDTATTVPTTPASNDGVTDTTPVPDDSASDSDLSKRYQMTYCSGDHLAVPADCEDLKSLLAQMGNTLIPYSPRNICYKSCYASWSQPQTSVTTSSLSAVTYLNLGCQNYPVNGGVSAKTTGSIISGTVCLSNRASGCS